jgi:hypothetical protein
MKITFKNGAVVEGTKEELQDILGKLVGVEDPQRPYIPDALLKKSNPVLPLEQIQKDQEGISKELNKLRALKKIKEEWDKLMKEKYPFGRPYNPPCPDPFKDTYYRGGTYGSTTVFNPDYVHTSSTGELYPR